MKSYELIPSGAASVYNTLAALSALESQLPSGRRWVGQDQMQRNFLNTYYPSLREVGTIPEIEAYASYDHRLLNDFLARMRFHSEPFPSFTSPDQIGAASITQLGVRWAKPALATSIRGQDGEHYEGVEFPNDQVKLYQVDGHRHPIVEMATTDPATTMSISVLDLAQSPGGNPFQLIEIATDLHNKNRGNCTSDFSHVQFPMVNLSVKPSSHWLMGMSSMKGSGLLAEIVGAKQLIEIKVNQFGASLRDEVKLDAITSQISFRPALTIDRPFLLWFSRKSLTFPLAAAYVSYPEMKNPGPLEF